MSSVASSGHDLLRGLNAQSTRLFERVDSLLESGFWPVAIALTLILFAVLVSMDFHLKLWTDELITLHLARLPELSQIASAAKDGADATPPLYTLLVHSILPYSPSVAVAVRLPSTIGLCATFLAVTAYARRRLPATYAIIAGLLATAPTIHYGSEGRSYGLVLCFASVSLLLWSLASARRRRGVTLPLLAICVAAMAALHYFTLFFVVCLFLAQFVRARSEPRFDYLLAIALLAPAAIVVAVHYPFIAATRPLMAHNFSTASHSAVLPLYEGFLHWPNFLFAVAMLTATYFSKGRRAPSRAAADLPAHELAALVLIVLAPAGVIGIISLTVHAFTDRYVLWTGLGIALLSALALRIFARDNPAVDVTVLLVLIAGLSAKEISSARHSWREGDLMFAALSSLPDGDEPIVLTDSHDFLELSYYAPAALRQRLVYPLCPNFELRDLGYDTDSINLAGLKRWTNLKVVPCEKALESGVGAIVPMTPMGFLPWPLGDESVTLKPLYMDRTKILVFRARRELRNP